MYSPCTQICVGGSQTGPSTNRALPRHGNDPGIYDPSIYTLRAAARVEPRFSHGLGHDLPAVDKLLVAITVLREGLVLTHCGKTGALALRMVMLSDYPLNWVCRHPKRGVEWATRNTSATQASCVPSGTSFIVIPDCSLSFPCCVYSYFTHRSHAMFSDV